MPRLSVEDMAKKCAAAYETQVVGFSHDSLVTLIATHMAIYKLAFPDKELGREIAYLLLRSQPKGQTS